MLTEDQVTEVWERRLAAETRSLYFGDLANRNSKLKQWITGISFFLSSGAAVTVITKAPSCVPVICSLLVAVLTAYSIAVGLERKVRTLAKLHYTWNQIADDYALLWNHTYTDEAESELQDLLRREREISELATTEAPYDQVRLGKWQDHVFRQYHLSST